MSGPAYHARTHSPGGTDPLSDDYIRFDFKNGNASPPTHWLYIATSDPAPPGGDPGMYLIDDGGAGIKILATSSGNLEATSDGGNLTLAGADGVSLTSAGGGITITSDALLDITAGAGTSIETTGDTDVTSHGGITLTAGTSGATSPNGTLDLLAYDALLLSCGIGDIDVQVSNAGSPGDHCLRVSSTAASPNEIFRIDSDGTIHGQTAVGAIVWDIT